MSLDVFKLDGRVALITGGNRGLGFAMAQALPERSAYCSSKGGLIQLTKVLALEWAAYNITVNALCPGPIATELNIPVMNNPQANQFFLDHIALGRWGRPEELGG